MCFHNNNITANDNNEIALACYNLPIDKLEKQLLYELLLTESGSIDGLHHTNGRIDVNENRFTKWSFTGNYYQFEILNV